MTMALLCIFLFLLLVVLVIKIDRTVQARARKKNKIIPTCPPNRPIINEQAEEKECVTEK